MMIHGTNVISTQGILSCNSEVLTQMRFWQPSLINSRNLKW